MVWENAPDAQMNVEQMAIQELVIVFISCLAFGRSFQVPTVNKALLYTEALQRWTNMVTAIT